MWTTGVTITVILLLGGVVLGCAVERQRRKLKLSRFISREPVPVEQLVATCFADNADLHGELVYWWERVASILRIDARLLRPDDRFDCELAPVAGFQLLEDELLELDELIDELSLACPSERRSTKLETFGACVRFLATMSADRDGKGGRNGEAVSSGT